MSFLQNLWADLLDKRLLPVVAVLAAGLVAVPLVLGRAKDAETPRPIPALASVDDVTSPGKVTLDPRGPRPKFIVREAKRRDPFARKKVKVASAKVANAGTSIGKALGGGSTAPSGGSSGGTSGGTAPVKTPAPPTAVNKVSVSFGQSGVMKTYGNVKKLTPLPSADNPLLVFNGFGENGKSATFLVSSEATPSGDGRCQPDPGNCQTITLSAGETEFFEVPSGTGGITQYELKVLAVTSKQLASKAN